MAYCPVCKDPFWDICAPILALPCTPRLGLASPLCPLDEAVAVAANDELPRSERRKRKRQNPPVKAREGEKKKDGLPFLHYICSPCWKKLPLTVFDKKQCPQCRYPHQECEVWESPTIRRLVNCFTVPLKCGREIERVLVASHLETCQECLVANLEDVKREWLRLRRVVTALRTDIINVGNSFSGILPVVV